MLNGRNPHHPNPRLKRPERYKVSGRAHGLRQEPGEN